MCFHNSLSTEAITLKNRYNATEVSNFQPIYHASGFHHPNWPIITNRSPNKIEIFRWGLIPSWISNYQEASKIKTMTLNAKVETIHQRKAFAQAAKTQRCIIPSTGFFEWQHHGKQKIPWFITHNKINIFSIAGLWDTWVNEDDGGFHHTFSLITMKANDFMANIHNTKKRMPLLLTPENEIQWLERGIDAIDQLTKHATEQQLKAHTISPMIGSKKIETNIPEIQKAYKTYIHGTLFG